MVGEFSSNGFLCPKRSSLIVTVQTAPPRSRGVLGAARRASPSPVQTSPSLASCFHVSLDPAAYPAMAAPPRMNRGSFFARRSARRLARKFRGTRDLRVTRAGPRAPGREPQVPGLAAPSDTVTGTSTLQTSWQRRNEPTGRLSHGHESSESLAMSPPWHTVTITVTVTVPVAICQ
jgi:hypothetical protein